MTTTRRGFIGDMGALALLALRNQRADVVLYNGHIITMDPATPRAQALAIIGGRIVAVGTNDDVRNLASSATSRVDLHGRTVVPGFIDGHAHVASAGLLHLKRVDCDLRSIAAIQAALRGRAAYTPRGEWVLGFKYDDTKTAEGRYVTRDDLDAAVPDHPVLISHRGGHSAYVNSAALALGGVTNDVPDPPGGRVTRDSTGRPTGQLLERAVGLVGRHIRGGATSAERRDGVTHMSRMLARSGVTSSHDAYGSMDDLQAHRDARDAGELRTRIYCLMSHAVIDSLIAQGVRTGQGDAWVRVGAMKATCDGSISERTARLSQPYVGRPDDHGMIVADVDELLPLARKAHAAGWQIGIHANGDVAIDKVLGIYETLQRERPTHDPRFRIEHCTVINDDLVRRMRVLGVIPTPFSSYVYYHGEKMKEYGAERLDWMFAHRSFLDGGVHATFGSDYPPGPYEPMMALQSCVTRTDIRGTVWGARQRISVEEAIRVGTVHGARASFEGSVKGSLARGKYADLVVLGRDPLREPPQTLVSIPIERTMVDGKWVYES